MKKSKEALLLELDLACLTEYGTERIAVPNQDASKRCAIAAAVFLKTMPETWAAWVEEARVGNVVDTELLFERHGEEYRAIALAYVPEMQQYALPLYSTTSK